MHYIDGFESVETAMRNEMAIRNNYNQCSLEDRDYLIGIIKTLKKNIEEHSLSSITQYFYEQLASFEETFNKRYKKSIVTFNEDYSFDLRREEGNIFCSTRWEELTESEILNPSGVIEQAIKDSEKIQKWKEMINNSNFKEEEY